ncbi:MAG: SDR family NAD(P)-dependent oxidoreductase, partial [Gemmatimonadaceae bacterium]
ADLDRELELIEVNCAALVHLTRRLLPWMIERRRGYIMNLASVAAFQPGPLMALYYASKAFVLSFSEAMSEENAGTGVVVSALCPGTIPTEFQAAAGIAPGAPPAYASKMTAREVAQIGVAAMFGGKRVVVPAARNRLAIFLNRFLPRRVVVHAVRRIQEGRLGQRARVKGHSETAKV